MKPAPSGAFLLPKFDYMFSSANLKGINQLDKEEAMNDKNKSFIKINEGNKDGVNVIVDNENQRAIIETKNSFDIYMGFSRRNQQGITYAEELRTENPAMKVFSVPFSELGSDKLVMNLNEKIMKARLVTKEIAKEWDDLTYIVTFDRANGKTPEFKHPPSPSKPCWMVGEVVHAGKYFGVLEQGVDGDKRFFQVIKTNSILQGKDDFMNREEAVKAKLPIGSKKYLTQYDKGRISVADYTPKQVAEPEAVALPINREQKDALMSFREAHGAEWKDKLGAMWMEASYPGVPKANAPLLQQVRNEQGPEWLNNLKDKDLYLGTVKEPVAKPEPVAKKEEVKAEPATKKPAAKRTKKLAQEM